MGGGWITEREREKGEAPVPGSRHVEFTLAETMGRWR